MNTLLYEIEAGQTLHLVIRCGDALWVQRGRLEAQACAEWLGDTLLTRRETWHEAHAFEAEAANVWRCVALAPTTLVLHRRRGMLHRLGASVRRLAGLISRSALLPQPPAVPCSTSPTARFPVNDGSRMPTLPM